MFNDIFRDKKIVITGNTGFKGSWLTAWLLSLGAEVIGISHDVPTEPALFDVLGLREKIDWHEDDIRDPTKLAGIIHAAKPDFLFHLAAQALVSRSYAKPLETLSSNIMGTANVLEALRTCNHPCCAVIITSDKCYDNVEWAWGYRENDTLGGKDIYSGSKGAAELVFKSYYHSFFKNSDTVRIASVRAGNVIGGGDWAADRIVVDCMRAWSRGETVTIRNPYATRPWQHVLEPLSGYLRLAQVLSANAGLSGESYNFGPTDSKSYTVQRLLQDLGADWQPTAQLPLFEVAKGEHFHEAGLLKLCCDKAMADLLWQPTLDYRDLIDFTSSWYKAYYQGDADMKKMTRAQIESYQDMAAAKKLAWAR